MDKPLDILAKKKRKTQTMNLECKKEILQLILQKYKWLQEVTMNSQHASKLKNLAEMDEFLDICSLKRTNQEDV